MEALKAKFEGYDRYFSWLKQEGKQLPSGVVVVNEAGNAIGFRRRWTTFLNAFMSKMSNWYLDFNMTFGRIADIESFLIKEVKGSAYYKTFSSVISSYTKKEKGTGEIRYLNENSGIACQEGMRFSVTTTDSGPRFFGYERFEFYETRAISRLHELYKWTRKEDRFRNTAFVPVFYHVDGEQIPLTFQGFDDQQTLQAAFADPMWLNLKDGMPTWTDKNGARIPAGNPLLYTKG